IGRTPPWMPPGTEGESREIVDAVARGEVIRDREVRRMRKDGTTLDLTLSVAALRDDGGAVSGAIAILDDISDRKKREAAADETARFREQFVGIVGHDLRNPLTAILTSAQLLLRHGELSAKQARVVARVQSSAER